MNQKGPHREGLRSIRCQGLLRYFEHFFDNTYLMRPAFMQHTNIDIGVRRKIRRTDSVPLSAELPDEPQAPCGQHERRKNAALRAVCATG